MKNTLIILIAVILLAVSPVAFAAECPLCDAVIDGNSSEVKRLLDNGANVNYKNKNGLTTLILATIRGQSKIAKVLLECGANLYISINGKNALDLAKEKYNPITLSIFEKYINDVEQGHEFPPCHKTAAN